MTPKDQISGIQRQQLRLEQRINGATGRIFALESQIRKLEQKRLNLAEYRRKLGLKLSEISTFELDLDHTSRAQAERAVAQRFPQRARDILKEYAQDFSKPTVKPEAPPNPPPPSAPEPPNDLFDSVVKKKQSSK